MNHDYISIRRHVDALLAGPVEQLPFRHSAARKKSRKKKKGKAVAVCEEFERDVVAYAAGTYFLSCCGIITYIGKAAQTLNVKDGEDEEEIECGCCYTDVPYSKMTQCEDGHLFCMECARRQAETLIGMRKSEILCMDSSACKYPFPLAEIQRFLTPEVFLGYEKLLQEDSLRKADLPDLSTCPFCDFACILPNPPEVDRLFPCQSDTCRVISCRLCRKKNHAPLTCEEAKKEDSASARHTVEEAMTEALLRECPKPKCGTKFFKEEGCNKMTCPTCRTMICYVCKALIAGYDHFSTDPNGRKQPGKSCPLWDDAVSRNNRDVELAAQAALKNIVKDGDIDKDLIEKDLKKVLEARPKKAAVPNQAANHAAAVAAGQAAAAAYAANLRRVDDLARLRVRKEFFY
ncbi:hypothetical protein BC829DRAFT_362242 [Chytridium lagenaria]|nr:hypothetical protein BC829DRAFT_362242 [Chytridium lagenaria]